MRPAATIDLGKLAERMVKRVQFHGCAVLVFLRPDGILDSTPEFTQRASAMLRDGAGAGFKIVGVYAPGVLPAQSVADARACQS